MLNLFNSTFAMSLCSYGSEVEHFLGKEEVPGSNPGIGSSVFYDFSKVRGVIG